MKPQCSCAVYSGILQTLDPLGGFAGLGVGGGGWRMHNRAGREKEESSGLKKKKITGRKI